MGIESDEIITNDKSSKAKEIKKIARYLEFEIIDKKSSDFIKVIGRSKNNDFRHAIFKDRQNFSEYETMKHIFNYYQTLDIGYQETYEYRKRAR